jgi:pyruvate dehydrogenase E1 component alpha subunit
MTAAQLKAFESDIAESFNRGEIRAPIHLYGGNEREMIEAFSEVGPNDWACCSWRSHYQCLLKGVPSEILRAEILAGRSISLSFPEYRIVSSAIVGGILPIALGIAWQIKRTGGKERVHCWLGDMTAETGIAYECLKYGIGHNLPIRWILEDNGKSVMTDTAEVWKFLRGPSFFKGYKYDLPWPHAGAGQRVQF